MSFIKSLFSCCNSSSLKKEVCFDDIEDKPKGTQITMNHIPWKKTKDTTMIGSTIIDSSFTDNQNSQSLFDNPEYIPINEIEVTSLPLDYAKKLELSDVIGNLLYHKRILINYRGIVKRSNSTKRLNSFEGMKVEMIKTTNYFWMNNLDEQLMCVDGNINKDFILNLSLYQKYSNKNVVNDESSEGASELLSNYLFMICFIKEINRYKIKFNDMLTSNILSDNVRISVSSIYPMIIPREAFVFVGNKKMKISLVSRNIIEILLENNKYVYHSASGTEITIGSNKTCTLYISDVDKCHCTLYYKDYWLIRDGDIHNSSDNGTFIYSTYPIVIYDGMHIKLFDKEIVINEKCK